MPKKLKLQIGRTTSTWIGSNFLEVGEFAFAIDTEVLYVGTGAQNIPLADSFHVHDAVPLVEYVVTQTSHGFVAFDSVYYTGTVWAKAITNDGEKIGTHLITESVDIDNFKVGLVGKRTLTGHGKTVGEYYFTSDATPGLVTATEPTANGSFSNPMFFVLDANTIIILNWRSFQIALAVPDYIELKSDTGNTTWRIRVDDEGTTYQEQV